MHEAPLYVNKIYACHVRGYVSLSRISSRREILENKNPKITKIAKETLHAKKNKIKQASYVSLSPIFT